MEIGHRIIEFAAVELLDGKFTYRVYKSLINPERPIDEAAEAVHGISEGVLINAPIFGEISGEVADFIRGAELIAHNAPFHIEFLNSELYQSGQESLSTLCTGVIDTLKLAREVRPKEKNNLDELIKDFLIEKPKRTLHGTELDAYFAYFGPP